jgi:hypothetical protein
MACALQDLGHPPFGGWTAASNQPNLTPDVPQKVHTLIRLQLKQFIEQWERFMDMDAVNKKRLDLKPIAKETMQMVEGVAFDCLQSTMIEVFKHGGLATLAPFLGQFLHELESYARECFGRGWDEHLQRAMVSSRLATEYLPKTRAALDACSGSQVDFHRRMATWESMLAQVSVQDRAFVDAIKEADSILAMLLSARVAQDGAESWRIAEGVTQATTVYGSTP